MVSKKAIIKDLTLKTLLALFHLNRDMCESVYVRSQAIFIPLDDPVQDKFFYRSSLLDCELRRKPLT